MAFNVAQCLLLVSSNTSLSLIASFKGHVTHPFQGADNLSCTINLHIKFEMPSFVCSKDIMGPKIIKMDHVTLTTPI